MAGRYASVYFSPRRGAAATVIGFIDRCTESIDVAVYALTHDGVGDALIRAHERKVKVRVLVDSEQAKASSSDDERLLAAGLDLRRDRVSGAMHNKFLIGDGMAVGTGSLNFSVNADERNAENFVVLRLSYVVREFQ